MDFSQCPGKQPAPEGVREVAWEGHVTKGARTDDEVGLSGGKLVEKGRDFCWIVLLIGIKRDDRTITGGQGVSKPGFQRRAFALILSLA